jgi:hypothetical protein
MLKRLAPLLIVALSASTLPPLGEASAAAQFKLTVTKVGTGNGRVTSEPAGIDCGSTCSESYPEGTVVTLSVKANGRSTFMGWKGDCSGTGPCQVTMDAARQVRARFAQSYRPDGWIKLCGLSTGCTIDPPPHPWLGDDRYNKTGWKQRLAVLMEDGEGVRFWLTLQNDGAKADTLYVQGCKGTPDFVINAVLVGLYKRPTWRAKNITKQFKRGTAKFSFPPASAGKKVHLTLNIIAETHKEGISYKCPVTISSAARPALQDTVSAKMTTY